MAEESQKSQSSAIELAPLRSVDEIIEELTEGIQKWRIEPEIDSERQHQLIALMRTVPTGDPYFYPFLYEKLTRADVEYLIANSLREQRKLLERLKQVLENKTLYRKIPLKEVCNLRQKLNEVAFKAQYIDLRGANLSDVDLTNLPLDTVLLQHADLTNADLRKSLLHKAHLERAMLDRANMQGVSLDGAHLEGAHLHGTHLEEANLRNAHLEGAQLSRTHLEGAILIDIFIDRTTKLENLFLSNSAYGSVILGDFDWNSVNLSEIDWSQIKILGDEAWADRMKKYNEKMMQDHPEQKRKDMQRWVASRAVVYKRAARTNRKLALALQEQGLADDARRFAYRSFILQRKALRLQRNIPRYLGSLFLDFLSGYGYKPLKSFIAYLLVIGIFMIAYHFAGHNQGWLESFVISMSAFHGRGFFPGTFSPGDPLSLAGAFEALIGLIIEVTFIATLTQRLFSK